MDCPFSPCSSIRVGQRRATTAIPAKPVILETTLHCTATAERGDRINQPLLRVFPWGQSMLLSGPVFVTDAVVSRTRQAQWNVHGSGIWIRQLQGERNKDERKQKSAPRNKAAALTWRSAHSIPCCWLTLLPSLIPWGWLPTHNAPGESKHITTAEGETSTQWMLDSSICVDVGT